MAKKGRPKFEVTPQLMLLAVVLLVAALVILWLVTPGPAGPKSEPIPDIRETKKSLER